MKKTFLIVFFCLFMTFFNTAFANNCTVEKGSISTILKKMFGSNTDKSLKNFRIKMEGFRNGVLGTQFLTIPYYFTILPVAKEGFFRLMMEGVFYNYINYIYLRQDDFDNPKIKNKLFKEMDRIESAFLKTCNDIIALHKRKLTLAERNAVSNFLFGDVTVRIVEIVIRVRNQSKNFKLKLNNGSLF